MDVSPIFFFLRVCIIIEKGRIIGWVRLSWMNYGKFLITKRHGTKFRASNRLAIPVAETPNPLFGKA